MCVRACQCPACSSPFVARSTRPRNLFAWTAPGSSYPEYVSLNDVGGDLVLTVRSGAPLSNDYSGEEITLDSRQARELGLALIQATNFTQHARPSSLIISGVARSALQEIVEAISPKRADDLGAIRKRATAALDTIAAIEVESE